MTQSDIINNNFSKAFECIKCSNAYDTGEILSEEKLFKQISERKHSTFDLSKFTVVGSPTITNDGIASGLSNSKYITIPNYLKGKRNYEIDIEFTLPKTLKKYGYVFSEAAGTTGLSVYYDSVYVYVRVVSGGVNGFTKPIANGNYKLNIKYNDGVGAVQYRVNNAEEQTYQLNVSNYVDFQEDILYLGGRISNGAIDGAFVDGSIDLKQFSITVDSKEVFSGNKTGIDQIKPDNYTVVGSPVISEDGIFSNGTSSNYLIIPNSVFSDIGNRTWKLSWRGTIALPSGKYVFGTNYNASTNSFINIGRFNNSNNVFFTRVVVNDNGTATFSDIKYIQDGNFTIEGKTYQGYLEYIGTKYTLGVSFDNWASSLTVDIENANPLMPQSNDLRMGYNWDKEIDLNTVKFEVDGNLVYQPCLKIPYTLSKTGSKIVDVAYRDRVIDLYEQEGNARYFTIDEGNKNFTLPMGEIYGMKADKTEVEEKISELSKLSKKLRPIGQPILRFDDTIFDDEVRFEGAAVSRTGYAKLFEMFGTTYGEGDGSTTFNLPDCRNRTLWGAEDFGYVEAGLPDHTHNVTVNITGSNDDDGDPGNKYLTSPGGSNGTRTLSGITDVASVANAIYGGSQTVQPPAIKVRVVARYK